MLFLLIEWEIVINWEAVIFDILDTVGKVHHMHLSLFSMFASCLSTQCILLIGKN